MSASTLLLGLDVGGSTTHLRGEYVDAPDCADEPTRLDRQGPGANPNRDGRAPALRTLVSLVTDVLADIPSPDRLVLCAGVSGAGRTDDQDAFATALQNALAAPDRTIHVEVVHDGHIALDAAYDTGSGIIVIAGTGSLVLGRDADGALHRAGGWGPILGDAGSGHALGRAALRAVAAALDGGPDTALCSRLHTAFALRTRDQLLEAVYQDEVDVAAVAPLLVDAAHAGDAVASRLLTDATDALAEQVSWIASQNRSIAPRITLLGGLLEAPFYAQALRQALAAVVPEWTVNQLETASVTGALRRARRLAPPDM